MAEETIAVGVIVEKRKSASPWIDHTWGAVAVMPGLPEAPRMTLIETLGDISRYYCGAARILLASVDTAHYRDNLMSGAPKLWVVMREEASDEGLTLVDVTADPTEGEAHTESGSNIVDTVPMIPEVAAFVASFVDEHHVEREFFKRKRDGGSDGGKRRKRGDGSGRDA
jgi:Protein of unknown function (DUF3305)